MRDLRVRRSTDHRVYCGAPPSGGMVSLAGRRRALGADSEEKREPASDSDTAIVDGLKALDPDRPIREADITGAKRSYQMWA
jgi:hypothetical protein